MGRGGAGGPPARAKTSVTESTVNLFKAACGPGALSLAFACSHAGLGLAPFVLVCLQCCCVYNMFLLIWLKQHFQVPRDAHLSRSAYHSDEVLIKQHFQVTGARTYGDLADRVFGRTGRSLVEFFVGLQQLGVCCVYFQFVAANIAGAA
jgi:amino acid permease